jgi:hypothetical protein
MIRNIGFAGPDVRILLLLLTLGDSPLFVFRGKAFWFIAYARLGFVYDEGIDDSCDRLGRYRLMLCPIDAGLCCRNPSPSRVLLRRNLTLYVDDMPGYLPRAIRL